MTPDAALDLALDYVRQGVPCLPCAIGPAVEGVHPKRPLTVHGHLDASLDEPELRRLFAAAALWLKGEEVLGVGLWLGPARRLVHDYDIKRGGKGGAVLLDHLHAYPDIARCRYRSISGALNVIVAVPEGTVVGNASPWDDVDLRGDAGWVVAPGTVTPWGVWAFEEGSCSIADAFPEPEEFLKLIAQAPSTNGHGPHDADEVDAYIAARDRSTPGGDTYARRVLDDFTAVAVVGNRHPALNAAVGKLVGLDGIDLGAWLERLDRLWLAVTPEEPQRAHEVHEVARWTIEHELDKGKPKTGGVRRKLDIEVGDEAPEPSALYLPETFWVRSPVFERVRDAARARRLGPDALLGALLGTLAALLDFRWVLPPVVGRFSSLALFVALPGPSGMGKGASLDAARDLLHGVALGTGRVNVTGAGTGEGFRKAFFKREGKPARWERAFDAILIRVDEGDLLKSLGERQGSTTSGVLRQMWSGESIAFAYSTQDANLPNIEALDYGVGMVAAIQPGLAGPMVNDTVSGGTQRWLWLMLDDPLAPDTAGEWPGPLDVDVLGWHDEAVTTINARRRLLVTIPPEVVAAVQDDRLAFLRSGGASAANGHLNLLRLKVACVVAIVHGRHPSLFDWETAGLIVSTSEAVLAWVRSEVGVIEEGKSTATGRRRGHQRVAEEAVVEGALVDKIVDRIVAIVAQAGAEGIAARKARDHVSSTQRASFEEALTKALKLGLVVEATEGTTAKGTPRRLLKRPR